MLDLTIDLAEQERFGGNHAAHGKLARQISEMLVGLTVPEAEAVLIHANRLAAKRSIVRPGGPE